MTGKSLPDLICRKCGGVIPRPAGLHGRPPGYHDACRPAKLVGKNRKRDAARRAAHGVDPRDPGTALMPLPAAKPRVLTLGLPGVAMTGKPAERVCLGYEGHPCTVSLVGADPRRLRCPPCIKGHDCAVHKARNAATRTRAPSTTATGDAAPLPATPCNAVQPPATSRDDVFVPRVKTASNEHPAREQSPAPRPRAVASTPPAETCPSDAWSIPLTDDEVLEAERCSPALQLGVIRQCTTCLRFRVGKARTPVDGYLRCLHDELISRAATKADLQPGAPDTKGRMPVVEDRRGVRPVYWLRRDTADLGTARACAYYLRHPCLDVTANSRAWAIEEDEECGRDGEAEG